LSDGRVHDDAALVEVGGLETALALHEGIDALGSHRILIPHVVHLDEVLLSGAATEVAQERDEV
jgi:hypothetical protein